jgi:PTH1 family peptidyl-tRNA hydrolase
MKLIIGLGNPGEKYQDTRHNVGFMVVDKLKSQKPKLKVFKTDTFMNASGTSVKTLLAKQKERPENLYVIHDDLDLPLGIWKIQYAKGPKDHGGINDIEQVLGTENFWRIRVGVDKRKPEARVNGEDYVLQDFSKEEKKILEKVIAEVCKKLATL